MKLFRFIAVPLLAIMVMFVAVGTVQAQVTLGSTTSPNFSLTNTVFPIYGYPLVTITGTGNASFNIGSTSGLVMRVTGTSSASNVNIQGTNDGTNFTSLQLIPYPGQSLTTSNVLTGGATGAAGLYYINTGALTKIKILSSATFTGTNLILQFTGSATDNFQPSNDPCQDMRQTKKSASIAITTATTTAIVAPVAGQNVYPCELSVVIGASTTAQPEYGTGATCGTGTTVLSGAIPASTYYIGFGGTFYNIPVANGLCILSTGTGGINGTLTYATIP